MSLFLGLDLSTQSLTALVIDTESGEVVVQESVSFEKDFPKYQHLGGHLPATESGRVHADPLLWLEAFDEVFERLKSAGIPMGQIAGISGSGQQHASIYLNERFGEILSNLDARGNLVTQLAPTLSRKTSPIWMDNSTGEQCKQITLASGGADEVCRRSGSVATERFTGPQIRKFAQEEPSLWADTATVHLVSSFFASVLAGRSVAIDRGDGAGMNLMNLASGGWDDILLAATADGLGERLPPISDAASRAECVSPYFSEKYGLSADCRVGLWSGDNPCSLVGMGAARPGKLVISLGTSDTLFAALSEARTDPNGYGHVFGNPVGGFMSLLCFRNGSNAREAVKTRHNLSWDDFDLAGLSQTEPGNGGRLILPFVDDESTPLRKSDDFQAIGWETAPSPAEWVRGVLEGQFLNIRLHSQWLGIEPGEILLTGGASQNDGIAQIVADVFQAPVRRLAISDSAALGAALIAACMLGHDLARLEEQFCVPEDQGDRAPNREVAKTYQDLLRSLQATLNS